MDQDATQRGVARIAGCAAAAAHRRDHHHETTPMCHPHIVEVVHLGPRAVMICHDCATDSGFLPDRDAEAVAVAHRGLTLGQEGTWLSTTAA